MSPVEREKQASLYALGLLEGEELAAFERALAADPDLSALVAKIKDAASPPAESTLSATAPAAEREKLLPKLTGPHPDGDPTVSSRSLAWFPWVLAVGFAVFAAFLWHAARTAERLAGEVSKRSVTSAEEFAKRTSVLIGQNSQLLNQLVELGAERTRLEIRVSTLEAEKSRLNLRINASDTSDPLNPIRAIAFSPQPEAPEGAQVAALWDPRRQAGVLDLSKLPAPAADKDYQLWILSSEATTPINAGVVSTGTPQANFRASRPVSQNASLTISLEPKGGSESPQGPVLYIGKF